MIPYRVGVCQLSQLHFDPENPRLPPDVAGGDDQAVLNWMLSDSGLLDLMDSIGGQGYFPGDPLLISPSEDDPAAVDVLDPAAGLWRVVEGNRRLASIRLLANPESAPRRRTAIAAAVQRASQPAPSEVPVVAFAKRDDVLTYLGFRHITGVKEWDPLEKARFLAQLRERAVARRQPASNRDLARMIGSKGPYVGRLLVAHALIHRLAQADFFGEVTEDDIPFSVLTLALNYDAIVQYIGLERADDPELAGLDDGRLRDLATWLFVEREDGRTALGDSRNMKLLARIVTESDAVAALSSGQPIAEAALIAEPPGPLLAGALTEARNRMRLASHYAPALSEEPIGARELLGEIAAHSSIVQSRLDEVGRPNET